MVNVTVSSAGIQGPQGFGWLSGVGAPSNSIGIDGDFYLDTSNVGNYYGPKTAGVWGAAHAFGNGISSLTAADTSVVVSLVGNSATVRTNTLDVIAADHPAAADWSNNGHKITAVANGTNPSDAAAFGQIPTTLPPTGTASGDLTGTYPAPTVARISGTSISGTANAPGKALITTGASSAAWTGTDQGPWTFNIQNYGAKGDGQVITDGAMNTGSAILTSASGLFTSADVGKAIQVKGAAVTGVTSLVTTVLSYQSATQVTLSAPNGTGSNLTGLTVLWATDDTTAIQNAINDAAAYAVAHGTAKVFVPPAANRFYAVAGPLVTGGSTHGNAQLTIPVVAATANKVALTFEGVGNGAGLEHWQQTVPQMSGSTLVSFGVFASAGAQASSITANGNPALLGGPAQPGGYGTSVALFSNMLVTLRNLSLLTTYSNYGLTYTAADFSGIAEANLENIAYGTTGTVPSGDFGNPNSFAIGLSIGLLMPANGNNDNNRAANVSCHGGYTFAFFATEHFVCDRLCLLYCWSALCAVGNYFGSGGSTHAITVQQASVEGCVNVLNVVGFGASGIGPWVFANIDTEISNPTFADRNSGAALNAALGQVTLTGLYNPALVTVAAPTGLKIINGQASYPATTVTGNYQVTVVDQTVFVNAAAGPVTVTLISAKWTPNTYTVKKIDGSANPVTVAAQAGETIDGASTYLITNPNQSITAVPHGGSTGAWYGV